MGAVNKLLFPLEGVSLLARSLDTLSKSALAELFVVVGHEAERVTAEAERALEGASVALRIVHCPDYAEGLSASLRAGLAAAGTGKRGALVALGDMPFVTVSSVDRILAAQGFGEFAVVPSYEGAWGNPVCLSPEAARAAACLSGDRGARSLLEKERARVRLVPVEDAGILRDIDTPGDLAGPATEGDTCG